MNKTQAVINGFTLTQGESFNLLSTIINFDDSVRTIEQMEDYLESYTVVMSQPGVFSRDSQIMFRPQHIDQPHFSITRQMTTEVLDMMELSRANKAFTPEKSKAHNDALIKRAEKKEEQKAKEKKA